MAAVCSAERFYGAASANAATAAAAAGEWRGLAPAVRPRQLDDGGLDTPSRAGQSYLQNILNDNTAIGRPDNIPLTTTVYRPTEWAIENFAMPSDNLLDMGIVPGGRRNGDFRPEWMSPQSLMPPKREVKMEEMFLPEEDERGHWQMPEQRANEWLRDNAAYEDKSGDAMGALDGYTVFDFEAERGGGPAGASNTVAQRQGFAAGRFWTPRTGGVRGGAGAGTSAAGNASETRFIYPGDLLRGTVQYALRPVATNGSEIGAPRAGIEVFRHKGRWAERFSVSEWHRDPVHETVVGAKYGLIIADPVLRFTNRAAPIHHGWRDPGQDTCAPGPAGDCTGTGPTGGNFSVDPQAMAGLVQPRWPGQPSPVQWTTSR
jgi:hypothetical protein